MIVLAELDWDTASKIAGVIGLIVSIVLAYIRVADFRRERSSRASLSAVLTRDLFVRYHSEGELVFLNLVVMTLTHPALIRRMTISLIDSAGLAIPLEFLRLGQPADRGLVVADHFFYSSSAMDIVTTGAPSRMVLMCRVASTADAIRSAHKRFMESLECVQKLQADGVSTEDAKSTEALERVEESKKEVVSACVLSRAIRPGNYRVTIELHWHDCRYAGEGKTVVAAGSVRFDESSYSGLRRGVEDLLRAIAQRVIAGPASGESRDLVQYPVVMPTSVSVDDMSDSTRAQRGSWG